MKKRERRREEKGITLIALIITVVVLIILAGIGIGALVNQDGIVDKANEAKLETEKKDIEEQINIMTIQSMDKYGNVIRETLKTKLEDLPEGKEIVDGDGYIGVIYPEYAFKIELSNGKVAEYIPPVIVDGVNIPEGYVASQVPGENTVEDGLVIYEGDEPVTEENHEEAMLNRNQYVWIPVEINSMVMCSSNSRSSRCNLVYDEEANTLTCQTHPATATDLVGRLYTGSSVNTGNNIYKYEMDFTKGNQTYNTSSYREPAVVTGNSSGTGTSYDGVSSILEKAGMPEGSTAQQFLTQLQSDFTAMVKSVAKNGGFYISRYEVGANGSSKKSQKVLTAYDADGSNYLGADTWYGLYKTIRNSGTNKQMIWGCQYDQVIKFIGEPAQIGHSYILETRALSGQNELDKRNNIYDLEGNNFEWTAEATSTHARVYRGSNCVSASIGYFRPASYRHSDTPSGSGNGSSSRSTLYL